MWHLGGLTDFAAIVYLNGWYAYQWPVIVDVVCVLSKMANQCTLTLKSAHAIQTFVQNTNKNNCNYTVDMISKSVVALELRAYLPQRIKICKIKCTGCFFNYT